MVVPIFTVTVPVATPEPGAVVATTAATDKGILAVTVEGTVATNEVEAFVTTTDTIELVAAGINELPEYLALNEWVPASSDTLKEADPATTLEVPSRFVRS